MEVCVEVQGPEQRLLERWPGLSQALEGKLQRQSGRQQQYQEEAGLAHSAYFWNRVIGHGRGLLLRRN